MKSDKDHMEITCLCNPDIKDCETLKPDITDDPIGILDQINKEITIIFIDNIS